MPLPDSWVDALFSRLQVRYGAAWVRMWEGVDPIAVKADWAAELAGFSGNPDALKHALEHLPVDRPPTVLQFKALCISHQPSGVPIERWIAADKASPEVVAAVVGAVRQARDSDPKAWAHRLRIREQNCDRLSKVQRDMWRAALDVKPVAEDASA